MLSVGNGEFSGISFVGITRKTGFDRFISGPQFGTLEGTGFLRETGDDIKKKEEKEQIFLKQDSEGSLESRILDGEMSTSGLEVGVICLCSAATEHAGNIGDDYGSQHGQDSQHNEEFNQGEALLASPG